MIIITEYMIHVWGGAWNHDAYPSIQKDLGIREGYHYFLNKDDVDNFLKLLSKPIHQKQGIAIEKKYGEMTHKRTVFIGEFSYNGQSYTVHYDFGYEYPEDSALFMFNFGNYSCDCNRSIFIREEYGDVMPELPCGSEIKMTDYHFEYHEEPTDECMCYLHY